MSKVLGGVLLSVVTITSVMAGRPGEGDVIQPGNAVSLGLRQVAVSPVVQGAVASSSRSLRTHSAGGSVTPEQLDELTASLEALDLAGGRGVRQNVNRLNTSLNDASLNEDLQAHQSAAGPVQDPNTMQEDSIVTANSHVEQNRNDDDNAGDGIPSDSLQVRRGSDDGSYDQIIESPQDDSSTSSGDPLDGSLSASGGLSNQFSGLALRENVNPAIGVGQRSPLIQSTLRRTVLGVLTFSRPIQRNLATNLGTRRDSDRDDTGNDDDDNDLNDDNSPPLNIAKKFRRGGPATN